MNVDLTKLTPDARRLNDMRGVLADENFSQNYPDADLYYMYRRVDVKNGLVRNITITLAKMLGFEFAKTKGHRHIGNFKEIYTVLEGEAIFLMQKGNTEKIEDVYAVKAKKGESAIIPADYGHVTINPSETESLKTGDWTAEGCKSDYSLFEQQRGACYYYVKGLASAQGAGEGTWMKNKNYKNVPELRFEKPLKTFPEDLSFLK